MKKKKEIIISIVILFALYCCLLGEEILRQPTARSLEVREWLNRPLEPGELRHRSDSPRVIGSIGITFFYGVSQKEIDEMVLKFSEYDFIQYRIVSEWLRLVAFRFNEDLICIEVLLDLLHEETIVEYAGFNAIFTNN